jgi:predicted ATP-dependent endonuclease of OLD family
LFFIEEPEAHTHPQMQYVFINNIKSILESGSQIEGGGAINLQSIISTHSSHIVSESDFDDIKYFYIAEDKYVKAKNLKSLEVEYKKDGDEGVQRFKFLKQYLTLHRSELFFADKAIFIEGETERILLPSIMKKIDLEGYNENSSLPLRSQNISIIEVGNYSHIFDRFIDFIGVKSLIITDIDPAKPDTKKETKSNVSKDTSPLKKCKSKDATTTTNASLSGGCSIRARG